MSRPERSRSPAGFAAASRWAGPPRPVSLAVDLRVTCRCFDLNSSQMAMRSALPDVSCVGAFELRDDVLGREDRRIREQLRLDVLLGVSSGVA